MGLMSRSVSIMRYRVKGEIEGSFWFGVEAGVRSGAFKAPSSPGDVVGMGWTSIDDFTDCEFTKAPFIRGNYVALRFRMDTVTVPSRVLEMKIKEEEEISLFTLGVQRLSSRQRRELKERLRETLRKQALSSIQITDVMWDTAKSVVYLGSHSVRTRELFEGYFTKCFGLSLVPLLAYHRCREMLTAPEAELLDSLKPCSMQP